MITYNIASMDPHKVAVDMTFALSTFASANSIINDLNVAMDN